MSANRLPGSYTKPFATVLVASLLVAGGWLWLSDAQAADPFFLETQKKKQPSAEELRKKYPYVSVSDRLEYEKTAKRQELPKLSPRAEEEMKGYESMYASGYFTVRPQSLAILHSQEVDEFIKREGFGLSRVPRPSPRYLELPETPPYPFAKLPPASAEVAAARPVELPADKSQFLSHPLRLPSRDLLTQFHGAGRTSFVSPAALGHVKSRDAVAGFVPHQFGYPLDLNQFLPRPKQEDGKPAPQAQESWQIRKLELVSLLKHDTPRVYLSGALPRMSDLADSETRDLGTFEKTALKELHSGENLVTRATLNQIRMVGSLRALQQCTACHHTQRGELLGAFSYVLERVPPRAALKEVVEPTF